MHVAILGATSHIAKNIVFYLSKEKGYNFSLYARDLGALEQFLKSTGFMHNNSNVSVSALQDFGNQSFDVILNCIGFADPKKQQNAGNSILEVTEHYDSLIIDYLRKKSDTKYISFSSGAVFGSDFQTPVTNSTIASVDINHITDANFYQISKLYSEVKHRSLHDLAIIDLRIYGFFSQFIDLNAGYLLCQIIRSIKGNTPFYTDKTDIVRDYVSPRDLACLIGLVCNSGNLNTALDVYSRAPVKKTEILDFFVSNYNLKVEYKDGDYASTTGSKPFYYSTSDLAHCLCGYEPRECSMDCIVAETQEILK
jgi:nucleoside-diphosphate-sugar epimerase